MTPLQPPAPGLWISRTRIAVKVILKHMLAPIGLFVRAPKGLRVLFYHRVNTYDFKALGLVSREITVPRERFERQLRYLSKRGYRSITLAECRDMLAGKIPMDPKAVLLTFDDGYDDNLSDAAPILAKYGFTATVFPVLEQVGKNNTCWPMADAEGLGDFMSSDRLKLWLDAGHEIGSHTLTHPILTHIDEDQLTRELAGSRTGFEALLGRPCISVAYPNGDVDTRVAQAAADAGYALGFTTRSGTNPAGSPTTQLKRTEVSVSDTDLIFALKMRGMFDWLGVRDTVFYRNVMRVLNKALRAMTRTPKAQTS